MIYNHIKCTIQLKTVEIYSQEGIRLEEKDMKTRLIEEFQEDPIYRLAVLNGLEASFFTDGILSMHKEITYSTVETGKIIERSDSTIRNHFRSDLLSYIEPEKFGKFYRLNYKSVFRLHLIFLLMEKSSKTTVDLLAELGMQPAISVGSGLKKISRSESRGIQEYQGLQDNDGNEVYENRLQALERGFSLQSVMLNISKYQSDLSEINSMIEIKELAIENKKTKAELKYESNRSNQLLTNSLRKSIQKPSFFGLFKKQEEIDISELEKEIEANLKEKILSEVEGEIEVLRTEIKKLEEKKEIVKSQLEEEKEKFSSIQLEVPEEQKKLIINTSI